MSNKAQLYKYKGNKCTVCGLSVEGKLCRHGTFKRMFELHHVNPESKDPNYSTLIKKNLSSSQIDELDKCILLCRNCHGLVHAQNIKIEGKITHTYENRTVCQNLSGWLVLDQIDKKLNFLSEDRLLLEPYIEKFANCQYQLVFGVDLDSSTHIIDRIKNLENHQIYSIWSANNKELLFQATNTNNSIEIKSNVKFRFAEMDGSRLPKGERFWCRNGFILYDNDHVQTEGFTTLVINRDTLSIQEV